MLGFMLRYQLAHGRQTTIHQNTDLRLRKHAVLLPRTFHQPSQRQQITLSVYHIIAVLAARLNKYASINITLGQQWQIDDATNLAYANRQCHA